MKNTPLLILLTIFLVFFDCSLSAQNPVKIKRLTGTIEFDGMPKEEAWSNVSFFTLKMHRPDYGSEPSEKSEVSIGYDDEYLWIGAKLYMHDASKIFEVTKKRDDELRGLDAFGIILDTYKDNETALAFFTAPSGLRSDYTISNDAVLSGGGPGMNSSINYSWNTFWDVKTTRDDQGWYVEMRIPFSSLKFKPQGDVATMGLIIRRNISANTETDTYPAIDPKYGYMAVNKPSLAQEIIIVGARPERPIYIAPYILGGFSRDNTLNEEETEYVRHDNPQYNIGVDLKYNINSNLTLDLTANTDFAQVEVDDQQVNLTRYDLFFPEKRMFFQERSSLFDFSLGGDFDNLFYSRNIGMDDGLPIRTLGGARLTGRIGKWDMGFLDMQTAEHELTPGENFGVLRLRRPVVNKNSFVGGIITSRLGMNGSQNTAYGIDGIFRLFGDDYLSAKWSQTYDNNIVNKMNSLDPSFMLFDWERRSEEGFAYKFNYIYSGEEFNPGVGFLMRQGIQGMSGKLLYGWLPGENSKLFTYKVNLKAEQFNRLIDGNLESMLVTPSFELSTKKGIHAEFRIRMQKEGVNEDFNLSDSVIVKSGEYAFTAGEVMIITPSSKLVSVMANLQSGQFYDGFNSGVMGSLNLNLSSSLKLTAMYTFNAIRFPERTSNNSLNVTSINMKALVMFSTKLSATLMVQYANTLNDLITNFRLRYNPREGNDFYIVLNDYRGVSNSYSIPEIPKFFNKAVTVKYIHTFIL